VDAGRRRGKRRKRGKEVGKFFSFNMRALGWKGWEEKEVR